MKTKKNILSREINIIANLLKRGDSEILKFIITGTISTIINYCVYLITYQILGLEIGLSTLIGYFSGVLISFYFSKKWVFRSFAKTNSLLVLKFILCYLFSAWLMYLINISLNNHLELNTSISWFIAFFFTATSNFTILKFFVFNR